MKNLLLSTAILLTSAGAFAQLSVKPNGAAETYVYVKNEILFVKQNITLEKNPVAVTEPSIYLRDGGQLIQGGTAANNGGSGFLSVQQTAPVSNAWAYNYWCSPIGFPQISDANPAAAPAGNTNFGTFSLYESTGTRSANQSLSIPQKEGTRAPLTISRRWLYTHAAPGTEAEEDYTRIFADYAAPAGYGFTMKGVGDETPGTPQQYDFRGRPNSGEFNIPVASPQPDPNGGPDIPQFTLTGNPYPSALDLNVLWYDGNNAARLEAIWFYDEDRTVASHFYSGKPFGYGIWIPGPEDVNENQVPGAIDYNPGTYTRAPFYFYKSDGTINSGQLGLGQDYPRRIAPVGQGFLFVGARNNPVMIRNTHRRFIKDGPLVDFNRSAPGANIVGDGTNVNTELLSSDYVAATPYRPSYTRLYVVFNDKMTRDLVLAYSKRATDGVDSGLDGLSPLGLGNDAYFPIEVDGQRRAYGISTINFETTKKVPFSIKLKNPANIKIMPAEELNKPYSKIYLYDSLNDTYRAITNNFESAGFDLPAGKYEDRFFIVYMNASENLAVAESTIAKSAILENVDFFQNNPQGRLEVNNPERYNLKSASVYDMSGKVVLSENKLGSESRYSFNTSNLSDGVYLVKLLTTDNVSIDYKTIVHNKN